MAFSFGVVSAATTFGDSTCFPLTLRSFTIAITKRERSLRFEKTEPAGYIRIRLPSDRFRHVARQPIARVRVREDRSRLREQPVRLPRPDFLPQDRIVVAPVHHRCIFE